MEVKKGVIDPNALKKLSIISGLLKIFQPSMVTFGQASWAGSFDPLDWCGWTQMNTSYFLAQKLLGHRI
jgi:hypothetical protein